MDFTELNRDWKVKIIDGENSLKLKAKKVFTVFIRDIYCNYIRIKLSIQCA